MSGLSAAALVVVAAAVVGRYDWAPPEGWGRVQGGGWGAASECGGYASNVVFSEMSHQVNDLDAALVELRAGAEAGLGEGDELVRAEITYPGHRANIELEVLQAGAVPVRQLSVVYVGRDQTYMAVYSVAAECAERLEPAIRASIASFEDGGAPEPQGTTYARKSPVASVWAIASAVVIAALLAYAWRRWLRR